jgi:hypothetical protein
MIIDEKLKKNDHELFLNNFGMCHPPDQPYTVQSGTKN